MEVDSSTASPPATSVATLKAILLLILFFLTFVFGLVPFALRRAATRSHPEGRRRRFAAIFGMLSCFGGGVFLATCLLDLLPQAHKNIAAAIHGFHLKEYTNFPLSEFLVAIGFFLVLTIEQLVLWFREQGSEEEEERVGGHGHSHEHRTRVPTILNTIDSEGRLSTDNPQLDRSGGSGAGEEFLGTSGDDGGLLEGAETDIHFDPDSHSTFRAVILVLALSLHAVFEGLALGLVQKTANALQLFGALSIHKSILGFSLGLRLVQSRLSTVGIGLCCLCFAIMAPIGGFVGVAVTDFISHQHANMVSGSLGAIACGTFLYVTAFEILPHELNERGFRIWKLLTLFLGYAVICLFVLFFPSK